MARATDISWTAEQASPRNPDVIESDWIINPLADKVGLVELRLENGCYQEVTQVHGEDAFETEAPFPVRLVPHWLTADGAWRRHIGGEPEDAQATQR